MKFNKKKKSSLIIVLITIILALIAIIIVKENNPEETTFIPCMFYKLTGIKCPGCGMTRAVHYLANGNIKMAMWYNLMLFPAGIVLLYTGYRYMIYLIKDEEIMNKTLEILTYILFVLIIIFAFVRNITEIFY